MIVLDQKNRIFTLHTQNTTYQMKADQYNVLLHTYYGSRIDGFDLSALIQYGDRSFTPNPSEAGTNRNYSLDVMPQEYSTCGVGDFRLPSIELELANGSHTADMRYEGFRLEKGKYAMEGLPGFYSNE
ncbi:glycoside hydrolase family 36 N-terminal domain-containing protein, partial [Sporofaciens musculi]|uniref:glycoside hydrolase family 36 N-terminal domain-containing protein n=1 Tax=Sporofaciens musculi TaxID=2681861 RepID=UPI0025A2F633